MIPKNVNSRLFLELDQFMQNIKTNAISRDNLEKIVTILKKIEVSNDEQIEKLKQLKIAIENGENSTSDLSKKIIQFAQEKIAAVDTVQDEVFGSNLLTEKILSYLKINDLNSASLVNKQMSAASTLVKIQYINDDQNGSLKDIGLKNFTMVMNFIEKNGMMIESLNLREFSINDPELLFVIQNCPNLKRLSLKSNTLTNYSIDSISNLKKLKILRAENNNIKNIDFIKNCPLVELEIRSRSLTDVQALSTLHNLNKLSLSGHELSIPSGLSELNHLEVLILISHKINIFDFLKDAPKLKELTLVSNQIEIKDLGSLKQVPNLHALTLLSNNIEEVRPLSHLQNLHTLYLSGARIVSLEPLKKMSSLEDLTLEPGDSLEDLEPLIALSNLKSLKLNLELRTTPLSLYPLSKIPQKTHCLIQNYLKILVCSPQFKDLELKTKLEEGPFRSLEHHMKTLKTLRTHVVESFEINAARVNSAKIKLAVIQEEIRENEERITQLTLNKKRCEEMLEKLLMLQELKKDVKKRVEMSRFLLNQLADLKVKYQNLRAAVEIKDNENSLKKELFSCHHSITLLTQKLKENESVIDRQNSLLQEGEELVNNYNRSVLLCRDLESRIVSQEVLARKDSLLRSVILDSSQKMEKARKRQLEIYEKLEKCKKVLQILLIH